MNPIIYFLPKKCQFFRKGVCEEAPTDANFIYFTVNAQEYWEQYWTSPRSNTPTKQQLYGHPQPITKTIQVRRTRHAGHCRRSKDELISDILLWTPSHGQAKAGWPARTYIQQICTDIGYSLENLLGGIDDREWWRERVREIRAGSATRWWWWWDWWSKWSPI